MKTKEEQHKEAIFYIRNLARMDKVLEIISEATSRIYYIGHNDGARSEADFPRSKGEMGQ
jgi:hypothetical protein